MNQTVQLDTYILTEFCVNTTHTQTRKNKNGVSYAAYWCHYPGTSSVCCAICRQPDES